MKRPKKPPGGPVWMPFDVKRMAITKDGHDFLYFRNRNSNDILHPDGALKMSPMWSAYDRHGNWLGTYSNLEEAKRNIEKIARRPIANLRRSR